MRNIGISILFVLLSLGIGQAQTEKSAVIKYDKTTHNFGKIDENKGSVTYEFKFTNTGDFPLVINNVTASCGCTTPVWTKEPLTPGKSGFIKVTFDPRNRPGTFVKTISVNSNAKESITRLQIQGEVLSELAAEEDGYPASIGDLRMSSRSLYFGDILDTESKSLTIDLYNTGVSTLSIDYAALPIYLKASLPLLKSVGPKQKATLTFIYDARLAKDYGIKEGNFYLLVGGAKLTNPDNRLFATAHIKEDFTKLTPQQRINAPILQIEPKTLDFGRLDFKQTKTIELTLTNSGKNTLFIRKMNCPNRSVKIELPKTNITPGGSIKVKVTIHETQIKSRIVDRISIITNDPENSSQTISVIASSR